MQALKNLVALLVGMSIGMLLALSMDARAADTTTINYKGQPPPSANRDHPTMKPVDLISYCIKNSSAPSNIVLDLFGGSGSTLIAAHGIGRHARLMELDPHYVDVICRRFQEHTGIKPINQATNQEHDFLED